MKKIKYQVLSYRTVYDEAKDENTQVETLVTVEMPYSESGVEAAKSEAYNGEYTVEDDGTEESTQPTQLDIIEAQVTYTAMMTDTLLEV